MTIGHLEFFQEINNKTENRYIMQVMKKLRWLGEM